MFYNLSDWLVILQSHYKIKLNTQISVSLSYLFFIEKVKIEGKKGPKTRRRGHVRTTPYGSQDLNSKTVD